MVLYLSVLGRGCSGAEEYTFWFSVSTHAPPVFYGELALILTAERRQLSIMGLTQGLVHFIQVILCVCGKELWCCDGTLASVRLGYLAIVMSSTTTTRRFDLHQKHFRMICITHTSLIQRGKMRKSHFSWMHSVQLTRYSLSLTTILAFLSRLHVQHLPSVFTMLLCSSKWKFFGRGVGYLSVGCNVVNLQGKLRFEWDSTGHSCCWQNYFVSIKMECMAALFRGVTLHGMALLSHGLEFRKETAWTWKCMLNLDWPITVDGVWNVTLSQYKTAHTHKHDLF
jgi:hypothetical protein